MILCIMPRFSNAMIWSVKIEVNLRHHRATIQQIVSGEKKRCGAKSPNRFMMEQNPERIFAYK
jgi:hypothetical protein